MERSTGEQRLYALDALRAFAMFLGITLHAAIAYQVMHWIPWVEAARKSILFDLHNLAVHAFRLQLFFLIAGFFARLSYQRHGPAKFARNRAQRILLPFLLGMMTIIPVTGLIYYYGVTGSMPYTLHLLRKYLFLIAGHLWFLEYLVIYLLLALALAPLCAKAGGFGESMNQLFRKTLRSVWKPAVLALPPLAFFSFSAVWADVGLPISVIPIPHVLAYYGVFFACGWLIHRNLDLLAGLQRFSGLYSAGCVLLLGILIGLLPLANQYDHPRYGWLKAAAMLVYNLYTWCAIFALTGIFLRWFNRASEWSRYLADASYWFYIVHLPVVLALQYALRERDIAPLLQFLLVLAGTLCFCAFTYHVLVRYTWIGRMLNGPRERPAQRGVVVRPFEPA